LPTILGVMSGAKARWWHEEGGRLRCDLCPHRCILPDGGIGRCGARQNVKGTLISRTYGQVCVRAVDQIEKKPMFHYRPGTKLLSLGTFGCNLSCAYCQNAPLATSSGEGLEPRRMEPREIVDLALKEGVQGIAWTFNEPTVWAELIMDTAALARENGLYTMINTNGYMLPEAAKDIVRSVDALNIDVKGFSEQFYEKADDKIEALIRIAAAANSMEFGVKGHDYDNSTFAGVFSETLNEKLYGDIKKIKERLESFGNVFYLTDNSGEVVFDLFLIGRLKKMGKRIVVGSKSEPVLNDVTVRELEAMSDVDVIATGDVVGTALDSLSDRARSLLLDPGWLILSKGMGNYETISEYEKMLAGRLIYLMRAKCEPVAAAVGVPRGSLVARAI